MRTSLPVPMHVTWRSTEAVDVVRQWIDTTKPMLVLEGGTGCGKSVAAAWAFAYFRKRWRHPPVWGDMPELASLAEWKPEWQVFDDAPLVVLDDLGTERDQRRAAAVLERFCNLASGRCIVTTNVPVSDVLSLYGERVQSRLIGVAHWVVLGGQDLRVCPPESETAPDPEAQTQREIEREQQLEEITRERHRREIAEREEADRIWREGQAERDAMLSQALAKLDAMSARRRLEEDVSDAKLNARRIELDEQIERLKKRANAEGIGEPAAWEDDDAAQ